MIRSIRLVNFKAIKDVEVELDRLTVFVGPNGSGKSSILPAHADLPGSADGWWQTD